VCSDSLRRDGPEHGLEADTRIWIVDPLDGTLNFVRKCGPSAISICLWDAGAPVFDAWWSDEKLCVSAMDRLETAVLCAGIPSSFDFNNQDSGVN
jgi:fructose-1,6-bisphosphatase/inositol monophosphatase family enzyme